MISMAAAELDLAGDRALAALQEGNLDAYDRWSKIAGQLVDRLAVGLESRTVAGGRVCATCTAPMAPPIAASHADCAVCRAAGGVWSNHR